MLRAQDLPASFLGPAPIPMQEVTVADWQELQAWGLLRPFEQRRLLASIRLELAQALLVSTRPVEMGLGDPQRRATPIAGGSAFRRNFLWLCQPL